MKDVFLLKLQQMNILYKSVILISIFAFLTSCDKNDELIDETQISIINECFESKLTSKTEVENNLIGKWILIEYSQTIFQDPILPKITLDFNDSFLVFENKTSDVIDTLQWEIEEINTANQQSVLLNTEEDYIELGLQVFCENYMYLQTIPLQSTIGYTYVYEKVE